MRDLEITDKNEITVYDTRSGTEIKLYYRNPTTQEEVAYQTKLYSRKGKKLIINPRVRVEMGLSILTGFREGDFSFQKKPISSDPASPNYQENWKELLEKAASDIISAFALAVFAGSRIDTGESEIEMAGEDDLPPSQRS